MSTTPESRLRDAIAKKLGEMKRAGEPIEFRKILGTSGSNGEPDWDLCYAGRTIKLEAKSPTGRVTKLQEYRMQQWAKAGAIVGVVRSVADVLRFIDEAKGQWRLRA